MKYTSSTLAIILLICICLTNPLQAEVWPLKELPDNIKPQDGVVSLIADYAHDPKLANVQVFLINRTDKEISLPNLDGDIFLKLETQNEDGQWVRAQTHQFPECLLSYASAYKVAPCHYITISGYQPFSGEVKKIRFATYPEKNSGFGRSQFWTKLISNTGIGLVAQKDIKKAATDDLAVYIDETKKARQAKELKQEKLPK